MRMQMFQVTRLSYLKQVNVTRHLRPSILGCVFSGKERAKFAKLILSFTSRWNGSFESHSMIWCLQWTINGLYSVYKYLEVSSPLMVYSLKRGKDLNDDGLKYRVVGMLSINWTWVHLQLSSTADHQRSLWLFLSIEVLRYHWWSSDPMEHRWFF